ncbi:MAG: DNA repair protein RadC [Alphaproteobacteria bacterium]|nr:DNA repair protein RadC [Alphaproteobacteria bacterium]
MRPKRGKRNTDDRAEEVSPALVSPALVPAVAESVAPVSAAPVSVAGESTAQVSTAPVSPALVSAAPVSPASAPKPHYANHRKRLRERFLADGGEGMQDYELLELLLANSVPRVDTKPIAKAILTKFGALEAAVAADIDVLQETKGLGESGVVALKVVHALTRRIGKHRFRRKHALKHWEEILEYLFSTMAHRKKEEMRVILLDARLSVIEEVVVAEGSVDRIYVDNRQIIEHVMAKKASGLILVHNHPTGDPRPSQADIELTDQLKEVCKSLDIRFVDHLIIGSQDIISMNELLGD